MKGECPIEESVVLDRHYPTVSQRYFDDHYFIPDDKTTEHDTKNDEERENAGGDEKEQPQKDIGENPGNTREDKEPPQKKKHRENPVNKDHDEEGVDERGDDSGHTCVKVHTNKLCVITLSHKHPVLALGKTVTKVSFDVGRYNRLDNQVSGKGKRGGQRMGLRSPVCRITCSDGALYTVLAGVHGKLVEVNERLVHEPELVIRQPQAEGYLAMVLPPLRNGNFLRTKLLPREAYDAMD